MEIDYKIRFRRTLYIIGQVIFLKIALILSENITCPFKKIFHIPCPFCGLTRAYYAFIRLSFYQSIYYNILFFPIIIVFFLLNVIFLCEIIWKRNLLVFIYDWINYKKLFIVVVFLFIISMVWGIIHGI